MASQTENGEVITLDNFETKMAKFVPTANSSVGQDSSLFALVDMGSNGIRFSISSLAPPNSRLLTCLYREREGTSLYDALHSSAPGSQPFIFSSSTIKLVSKTLARFALISVQYGVPASQTQVFATEAMRTAHNKTEMLEAIYKASGLRVNILSPGMESLFGAMGARSGYNSVDGLFMDLGGGSVQMAYVNSKDMSYDLQAAKAATSMPFGAAKLTDSFSNQSVAETTKEELETVMKKTFDSSLAQFTKLKAQAESNDGVSIYFCGGGFRGYGYMLLHTHDIQPYPIPDIGGFTVSGEKFVQTKAMLKANSKEGKIFGMSKRRRQQFPAIVMVVEAIVKAVPRIKQVVFCSGGNREGVLYMKLPPAIRESSPLDSYPGGFTNDKGASVDTIVSVFSGCLVKDAPSVFNTNLQRHIARNIWVDLGASDDANSAKSLHSPISGVIASLPGLTHETRAIISLTMCARWGADLAPIDRKVYDNLRLLIGPVLSFWCDYIGTVGRLFAMIYPAYPADDQAARTVLTLGASRSDKLGKSGKKSGIKLSVRLMDMGSMGATQLEDIVDMFGDVGKGLDIDQRIQVEASAEGN